jgi:hypothetical protein
MKLPTAVHQAKDFTPGEIFFPGEVEADMLNIPSMQQETG